MHAAVSTLGEEWQSPRYPSHVIIVGCLVQLAATEQASALLLYVAAVLLQGYRVAHVDRQIFLHDMSVDLKLIR